MFHVSVPFAMGTALLAATPSARHRNSVRFSPLRYGDSIVGLDIASAIIAWQVSVPFAMGTALLGMWRVHRAFRTSCFSPLRYGDSIVGLTVLVERRDRRDVSVPFAMGTALLEELSSNGIRAI